MNNLLFFQYVRKTQPKTIIFQVHVSLSELFAIMLMMFVSRTTNSVLAINPVGQERYDDIIYMLSL